MTPDTSAEAHRPSSLPASLMALLTAFGTGATFAYTIFGLPGFTRVREQASELGVLLVPSAAALAMMLLLIAAQRFFIPGYAATAAGAFVGVAGFGFLDDRAGGPDVTGAWLVLIAVGGGIALAGLALAGTNAGGGWPKAAIAIGFATGFAVNGKVVQLVQTLDLPPYLPALVTCALAILAAIVARQSRSTVEGKPGVGAAVTVTAGVVVMTVLLIRSRLLEQSLAANSYVLLAFAGLTALAYAWATSSPSLAVLPVLGFGVAAPMTALAMVSGISQIPWPVFTGAVLLAAIAGAVGRLRVDLPWEVLGVLAAGGGLLLISMSVGTARDNYLLMACGGTFALAAGMVRAAVQPAGATTTVFGLATMMLAAQVLGPVTLEALRLNRPAAQGDLAVLASVAAAAVVVALFALGRAGRKG